MSKRFMESAIALPSAKRLEEVVGAVRGAQARQRAAINYDRAFFLKSRKYARS
jgi:hypothetical protein